jgi:Retrotransposon gag protein.
MDAQQFNAFMVAFQNGMAAMVPAAPAAHTPSPKISVRIPMFKGAPKENIITWMLQVQNLFAAQGIEDEQKKICYAATGFEDAALHWYLNKVATANAAHEDHAFDEWKDFATNLRQAFQPPNYQQHLRQQLRNLRQYTSVQEYASRFRNIMGQITGMGEDDQIAYFIEGLKPSTKMEVSYRSPGTFEETWEMAVKYDTAMFGITCPSSSYQSPAVSLTTNPLQWS